MQIVNNAALNQEKTVMLFTFRERYYVYLKQDCLLLAFLVMPRHFRSRDKDGGHTIRSTIAENPMYRKTS